MHLRGKRLRFGIKTFTEYFFGRSDTLYFYTDALVLSNPPIGPESKTSAMKRINITIDAKSGRVRIELSEEQPTTLAPAKERKQNVPKQGRVHVRAHWRRRPAKP